MSERKVLNKYYPPDFDPSKIPKLRLPRNRQYSIRIMAPFNMKCNTCGEYIYKGKKFNSRKETVENEDYLGLKIFRFYIKCPRCVAEIAFKTDPQTTDYELEDGATRNFEAIRTAEMLAEKERKAKEEEELNNPMKVLENRTKASRQEMEMLETLEELRELNSRHSKVDHEDMLQQNRAYEEKLHQLQEEEDEQFVKSLFGESGGLKVKRLLDKEDDEDKNEKGKKMKPSKAMKPTDHLSEDKPEAHNTCSVLIHKNPVTWEKSVGCISSKSSLSGLVRKKNMTQTTSSPSVSQSECKMSFKDRASISGDSKHKSKLDGDISNSSMSTSTRPTALGLLGNYSDSSSAEDTE